MGDVQHITGENEKRTKFVRLAEKRTINAIKAIRTLGKLGNKSHYEYTERDVKKIVSTLQREVEELRNRMSRPSSHGSIDFKLD